MREYIVRYEVITAFKEDLSLPIAAMIFKAKTYDDAIRIAVSHQRDAVIDTLNHMDNPMEFYENNEFRRHVQLLDKYLEELRLTGNSVLVG